MSLKVTNTIDVTLDSTEINKTKTEDLVSSNSHDVYAEASQEILSVKKEYSIVGDAFYAGINSDVAPTWLTNLVTALVDVSVADGLVDYDLLVQDVRSAIDSIDVAANTYVEQINFTADVNGIIGTRLDTLNATLDGKFATIVNLDLVESTSTSALATSVTDLRAEFTADINSRATTIETAFAAEDAALASSITALTTSFADQETSLSGTADAVSGLQTYVGLTGDSFPNGTGMLARISLIEKQSDGQVDYITGDYDVMSGIGDPNTNLDDDLLIVDALPYVLWTTLVGTGVPVATTRDYMDYSLAVPIIASTAILEGTLYDRTDFTDIDVDRYYRYNASLWIAITSSDYLLESESSRSAHVADVYIQYSTNASGIKSYIKGYKFIKTIPDLTSPFATDTEGYGWSLIVDTDAQAVYIAVLNAQGAADGKISQFFAWGGTTEPLDYTIALRPIEYDTNEYGDFLDVNGAVTVIPAEYVVIQAEQTSTVFADDFYFWFADDLILYRKGTIGWVDKEAVPTVSGNGTYISEGDVLTVFDTHLINGEPANDLIIYSFNGVAWQLTGTSGLISTSRFFVDLDNDVNGPAGLAKAVSNLEITSSAYTDQETALVENKFNYNSELYIDGFFYKSGFGLDSSAITQVNDGLTSGTAFDSEFWINAERLVLRSPTYPGISAVFNVSASGISLGIEYTDATRNIPRGAHVFTDAYLKGDMVTSFGTGYTALLDVPASTAITNATYWEVTSTDSSSNILNPKQWIIGGTGTQGSFIRNGDATENSIVMGVGPNNISQALWRCQSNSGDGLAADGGWYNDSLTGENYDPTKTHRFIVWAKQSEDVGSVYLGCRTCLTLADAVIANPYFWSGDLPANDKWYLIVGIMHGSGYTGSDLGIAGVYDPDDGTRVINGTEFKSDGATTQRHRAYLFYSNSLTNVVHFARPRVDEVNGDEPSLSDLMGRLAVDGVDAKPAAFATGFETVVEQDDLVIVNGSKIISTDSFSGISAIEITSNIALAAAQASGSGNVAYLTIPENLALMFAGENVLVSFYAKEGTSPSTGFSSAYSTNDNGNSGFTSFVPTSSYQKFSFEYLVANPVVGGVDYIIINADDTGTSKQLIIDNVSVTIKSKDGVDGVDGVDGLQGLQGNDGANGIAGASAFTLKNTTNCVVTPNSITGTQSTNWISGGYSEEAYEACAVQCNMVRVADALMMGLSNDDGLSAGYTSIDYAIYLNTSGNIIIYESGSSLGTFIVSADFDEANDVFGVFNSGDKVEYKRNGVTFYTSLIIPSGAYRFDCSFAGINDAVTNVVFAPSGANGTSTYFHIAYADDAAGTGFSQSSAGKLYIGTYVDSLVADAGSTSGLWQWQLVKGLDGTNGLAGTNGTNGQTSYLHIAYANDALGATGFDIVDSTNKSYIGQYTDFLINDSIVPGDYSWTLIKGSDGSDGLDGSDGSNGSNGVRGTTVLTTSNSTLLGPADLTVIASIAGLWATAASGTPYVNEIDGDTLIVTNVDTSAGWTHIYEYNGSAWTAHNTFTVNGNQVVAGTLSAGAIGAGALILGGVGYDVDSPLIVKNKLGDKVLELDNTTDTMFLKGKLSADTVDIASIQESARQAINPYYLVNAGGTAEDVTTVTSATPSVALNSIATNGKTIVSWKLNGSGSSVGNEEIAPEWKVEIRRTNSTGAILNSGSTDYIGYANNLYIAEIDEFISSDYGIDIEGMLIDDAATANEVYYIKVSKIGTGPLDVISRTLFKAEAPSFTINDLDSTGGAVGYSWTDKETGFTIKSGTESFTANQSKNISFNNAFSTIWSATISGDTLVQSSNHYESVTELNPGNIRVRNQNPYVTSIRWIATGIV